MFVDFVNDERVLFDDSRVVLVLFNLLRHFLLFSLFGCVDNGNLRNVVKNNVVFDHNLFIGENVITEFKLLPPHRLPAGYGYNSRRFGRNVEHDERLLFVLRAERESRVHRCVGGKSSVLDVKFKFVQRLVNPVQK